MKQRGFVTHFVYLVTIAIKAMDGVLETLLGLLIAVTGPEGLYLAVLQVTAPELEEHPGNHALSALQHGAAGLTHTSASFSIFYLLVHGVLKTAIAASLLLGNRWIFPYACVILAGFIGIMAWHAAQTGSAIAIGLAVFDLFTLLLVVKEWVWPYKPARR